VAGGIVLLAGPAFAHECTNASKPAGAGAQLVIGANDEVVDATNGVMNRFEKGLIGEDGEGFHGLIGFDFDGDGAVDLSTYIVGPTGAIPRQALKNGPACQGTTSIETYFTECVTG
jgi:hypothetical protein